MYVIAASGRLQYDSKQIKILGTSICKAYLQHLVPEYLSHVTLLGSLNSIIYLYKKVKES